MQTMVFTGTLTVQWWLAMAIVAIALVLISLTPHIVYWVAEQRVAYAGKFMRIVIYAARVLVVLFVVAFVCVAAWSVWNFGFGYGELLP
ncbi:MAG: hypothetical protein AAF750_08610 [Planctomycetota bacterium]